jgi:hypothetical protein
VLSKPLEKKKSFVGRIDAVYHFKIECMHECCHSCMLHATEEHRARKTDELDAPAEFAAMA